MKGRFKMISREMRRDRYIGIRKAFAEFMKCYPFTTEDLDGEEWRPIEGFDGYQVSSYGRVKSFKRGKPRIMKFALSPNNYIVYSLRPSGVYSDKQMNLHRLVAEAFIPNPDNKPQVNHRDGCKFNNNVNNLEWATPAENVQHAYNTGLMQSGAKHCASKIRSEADIIYVRENPDNLTGEKLAEMFGVTKSTISNIQTGKTHKQMDGKIRAPKRPRISDDIRQQIKSRYKKNVLGCGIRALSKIFGCDSATILRIVNDKD